MPHFTSLYAAMAQGPTMAMAAWPVAKASPVAFSLGARPSL